jgi:hypothetical protein
VHREEVSAPPIALSCPQELDSRIDQTAHLVGVNDRVERPYVVGVTLERREPGGFGSCVVAALLEPECLHASHEGGARIAAACAASRSLPPRESSVLAASRAPTRSGWSVDMSDRYARNACVIGIDASFVASSSAAPSTPGW